MTLTVSLFVLSIGLISGHVTQLTSQPTSLNFLPISTEAGSRRSESITHLQNAARGTINSAIQFRSKNVTKLYFSYWSLLTALLKKFQLGVICSVCALSNTSLQATVRKNAPSNGILIMGYYLEGG